MPDPTPSVERPVSDHQTFVSDSNRNSEGGHETRTLSRIRTDSTLPPHRQQTRKNSLKSVLLLNLDPKKPVGHAPSFWQGIRAIIFTSWLNILLVFVPLSWAFHFAVPDKHALVFVFSFFAIIPLAKLLSLATDELSIRVGQTLASFLNATLGNAIELIVSVIAIDRCELQVVQSSHVGSILNNLLLVLGMCFFAGGTRFQEQGFGSSASQIKTSLLTLSVIALLLPAAFYVSIEPVNGRGLLTDGQESSDIKKLSHAVAIILLLIYVSYLVFQLWSHAALYDNMHESQFKSTPYTSSVATKEAGSQLHQRLHMKSQGSKEALRTEEGPSVKPSVHVRLSDGNAENGETERQGDENTLRMNTCSINENSAASPGGAGDAEKGKEGEEGEEMPSMSLTMCIGFLIVVIVLVVMTAMFLVDNIDGVTSSSSGLSKEWVGLILLPIVGNAAEHVTAVTVSVEDKLNLSIGVAVGKSIQIALFVSPLMIVIAWILGKPLILLFDPFESVTLFLAVIAVNYTVADGKSNWLEGMILMCLYAIIAVSFWFYPGSDIGGALARCA